MSEFRHTVSAVSGHYGYPGMVPSGGLKTSFKYPSPATVRGYLESAMGMERGSFEGDIALGILRAPSGHQTTLRKNHIFKSATGEKPVGPDGKKIGALYEPRIFSWEVWLDVTYQVAVRGPMADRVRKALQGEGTRYGVLSLGTSDDVVHDTTEEAVPARWVVPGTQFPLIIESKTSFSQVSPTMGRFALSAESLDIPEEAWLSMRVVTPKKARKKPIAA